MATKHFRSLEHDIGRMTSSRVCLSPKMTMSSESVAFTNRKKENILLFSSPCRNVAEENLFVQYVR
eukprot:UN18789